MKTNYKNTGIMNEFKNFLSENYEQDVNNLNKFNRGIQVDYKKLKEYDQNENTDLSEILADNPDKLLYNGRKAIENMNDDVDKPHILFSNYDAHETKIRDLRDVHLGTMIKLDGKIAQESSSSPKADIAVFSCNSCQTNIRVPQPLDYELHYPRQCTNDDCNVSSNRSFNLRVGMSTKINFKRVELQEPQEELKGGGNPQTITVMTKGEMATNIQPGDRVTITGIYRAADQGDSSVFRTYLEGNNIKVEEKDFDDLDLNKQEKETIIELSKQDDIYEKLTDSFAPSIHGLRTEKKSIVFQLFGGVRKTKLNSTLRGDIHILFVGDPGTGKTIDKDAIIRLEDGSKITIEEFVEEYLNDPKKDDNGDYIQELSNEVKVLAMNKDGEIEPKNVEAVWKKRVTDKVYEITLENGNTIKTSGTHPLFTTDGNAHIVHKKIKDLQNNEFIAIPREYNNVKESNYIPDVNNVIKETYDILDVDKDIISLPNDIITDILNDDKIPTIKELKTIINGLVLELGNIKTIKELRENYGSLTDVLKYKESYDFDDNDSIKTAHENLIRLESLAWGDISWSKINSIEKVDYESDWMYDLQVEDTHNYISNDIMSHNSQLLRYASKIAPRSVMTNGKGSSEAGLTASAVRDSTFKGEEKWTLKAGALVLADKGIACVDELDKMDEADRSAMHEGLEQQTVSINKAGINSTLKSRCSLLSAANPSKGRWDNFEPIPEQIDLDPALISRFDLIFAPEDNPTESKDKKITSTILDTNKRGQQLEANLQPDHKTASVEPDIKPDLFRKYIAYARKNCFPVLTDESEKLIKEFFVDFRIENSEVNDEKAIPVTLRKMQGIVRLSEAAARIQLSDTIEKHHAEEAINLVLASLKDVGYDEETGKFDIDKVENNQSASQRETANQILKFIETIAEDDKEYKDNNGASKELIIKTLVDKGYDKDKVEHRITKLSTVGKIYKNKDDEYCPM